MNRYTLITAFFFATTVQSTTITQAELHLSDNGYRTFIPKGWSIFKSRYSSAKGIVKGELNGDGIDDLLLILVKNGTNDKAEEIPPRKLLILFGQKSGGYRFAGVYDKALHTYGWGGLEPLDSIKIKRQIIVINHHGGSGNNRWSTTHKWQFRNNDWYLIGKTQEHNMSPAGFNIFITEDDNLIAGTRITTKKSGNEDMGTGHKIISTSKPLRIISLTSQNIDSFNIAEDH